VWCGEVLPIFPGYKFLFFGGGGFSSRAAQALLAVVSFSPTEFPFRSPNTPAVRGVPHFPLGYGVGCPRFLTLHGLLDRFFFFRALLLFSFCHRVPRPFFELARGVIIPFSIFLRTMNLSLDRAPFHLWRLDPLGFPLQIWFVPWGMSPRDERARAFTPEGQGGSD